MHSMDSPQNFYYVHERLSSSSNKLKRTLKELQTSSTSFATLDFSTSISLDSHD